MTEPARRPAEGRQSVRSPLCAAEPCGDPRADLPDIRDARHTVEGSGPGCPLLRLCRCDGGHSFLEVATFVDGFCCGVNLPESYRACCGAVSKSLLQNVTFGSFDRTDHLDISGRGRRGSGSAAPGSAAPGHVRAVTDRPLTALGTESLEYKYSTLLGPSSARS